MNLVVSLCFLVVSAIAAPTLLHDGHASQRQGYEYPEPAGGPAHLGSSSQSSQQSIHTEQAPITAPKQGYLVPNPSESSSSDSTLPQEGHASHRQGYEYPEPAGGPAHLGSSSQSSQQSIHTEQAPITAPRQGYLAPTDPSESSSSASSSVDNFGNFDKASSHSASASFDQAGHSSSASTDHGGHSASASTDNGGHSSSASTDHTGHSSSASIGLAGHSAVHAARSDSPAASEFVAILRDDRQQNQDDGSYTFDFEGENGIRRSETGSVGASGSIVQTGSYSYTLPDGSQFELKYTADENGFQAESPSLPSMPEYVLEQIAFAAANPQSEDSVFLRSDVSGHEGPANAGDDANSGDYVNAGDDANSGDYVNAGDDANSGDYANAGDDANAEGHEDHATAGAHEGHVATSGNRQVGQLYEPPPQ